MITSLKDNDGKIISYVEWRLVGQSGFDREDGEYVFISDFWIHELHRGGVKIGRLIDEIMRLAPSANYCYFQRLKRNEKLRIYSKSKRLNSPKGGRGDLIVSTPKGVMSAKEARKKNLGGEVICEVW